MRSGAITGRGKRRICLGDKPRPRLLYDCSLVETAERSSELTRGEREGSEEGTIENERASVEISLKRDVAGAAMSVLDLVSPQDARAGAMLMLPTSTDVEVARSTSSVFDSGDMIMTAGLLAHPESSLKV